MQAKVTTHGRVTIPAELRRKYGIKSGTRIAFIESGQNLILQPLTREYVHSLRGKYRDKGLLKALMMDRKREREV
jgi:AbrB family looped-hinge helix DNA binding protein